MTTRLVGALDATISAVTPPPVPLLTNSAVHPRAVPCRTEPLGAVEVAVGLAELLHELPLQEAGRDGMDPGGSIGRGAGDCSGGSTFTRLFLLLNSASRSPVRSRDLPSEATGVDRLPPIEPGTGCVVLHLASLTHAC